MYTIKEHFSYRLKESSNSFSRCHLSRDRSTLVRFIRADTSACSFRSRTIWRCRLFRLWLPERYEKSGHQSSPESRGAKLSHLWFFWREARGIMERKGSLSGHEKRALRGCIPLVWPPLDCHSESVGLFSSRTLSS